MKDLFPESLGPKCGHTLYMVKYGNYKSLGRVEGKHQSSPCRSPGMATPVLSQPQTLKSRQG